MRKRSMAAVLAVALTAGAGVMAAQYNGGAQYYGPPQPGYGQPAWDAAPPEFRAAQQRGFHDGIEGARKDFKNHRPPDVENRDEYRNPKFISPPDRADYRMGFQRGYQVAVRHMYGPGYWH
jgi:hypothetical protein